MEDKEARKEATKEDECTEISRLEDIRQKGALSESWLNELEDGLNCSSCFGLLVPNVFPLVQGNCGHTICETCYQSKIVSHFKNSPWVSCPCSKKCRKDSFSAKAGCWNGMAMQAITFLSQCRNAATRELNSLHDNWTNHVQVLTKELESLRDVVGVKEAMLNYEKKAHAETNTQWKDMIVMFTEEAKENQEKIRKLKGIVKLLEMGHKYYYLRCPKCKTHVEKIPMEKFTNSVPCHGEFCFTGWNEIIDDIPFDHDFTSKSQLHQTQGFKNMRLHLKTKCLGTALQGVAKEEDLPPFYQLPKHRPPVKEKRKRTSNSNCLDSPSHSNFL